MLKVAVVRKANKTWDDKRSELHSPKAFDAVLADLLANLNAADEEYQIVPPGSASTAKRLGQRCFPECSPKL